MLKKSPVDLKEVLVKGSLALLVLSILASVITIAPVVKAQGYPNVPTFPPSTPTPIPSPTAKPSPTASPSPTEIPWHFPTYNPTQNPKAEEGFWSPITIGIVAVALVAFTIPAAFFYTRRGKQKMLLDEMRQPEFPSASNRSAATSRYTQSSYQSSYQSQQSSKTPVTTRYGQTSSYGYRPQQSSSSVTTRSAQTSSYSRPSAYTKFCPHCKRAVRNDQNVCPHCDKRL